MSDQLPNVTVLIPTRPDLADVQAVTAARRLEYPEDKLEILVARGRQPSVQRNAGLRAARGALVYFLDDDSLPEPANLRRAAARFADPKVKMVGGPNVCPPDAPELERVFALVLGSWLAFGPSRARYTPVGSVRATGEKELILCNLIARRDAVMELGGFNEALYPNEENALMDALRERGGKLIYDPEFRVQRRPRPTLKAFAKMLMNYGRGRAEQFRVHPTPGSALNFVPPLLCLYLLLLPALSVWWPVKIALAGDYLSTDGSFAGGKHFWTLNVWLVPLIAYLAAVVVQAGFLIRAGGAGRSLKAVPLLVASHVFYGAGFWRGLFTRLKPPGTRSDVPVTLEAM